MDAPEPGRGRLEVILHPTLVAGWRGTALVASFALFGSIATGVLIADLVDHGAPDSVAGWLAVAVGLPLALGVDALVFQTLVLGARRLVAADRLDATDDVLRVRVSGRWGMRTDTRVARSALRAVEVSPNQGGLLDVWAIHHSGLAFRIVESAAPEHAHRVRAQIAAWLGTRRISPGSTSREEPRGAV